MEDQLYHSTFHTILQISLGVSCIKEIKWAASILRICYISCMGKVSKMAHIKGRDISSFNVVYFRFQKLSNPLNFGIKYRSPWRWANCIIITHCFKEFCKVLEKNSWIFFEYSIDFVLEVFCNQKNISRFSQSVYKFVSRQRGSL